MDLKRLIAKEKAKLLIAKEKLTIIGIDNNEDFTSFV
jgi:hypothetical protein